MKDIVKEIEHEIALAHSAITTYSGFQKNPETHVDYYDKMILRTEGKVRGLELALEILEFNARSTSNRD